MVEPLLQVKNLSKVYNSRHWFSSQDSVVAADRISFTLNCNETLGLVGESGCGKTTVGKMIVKLVAPTGGHIQFNGMDVTHLSNRQFRPLRSQIQMIFQDLDAALNPKMRIGDIIAESVKLHSKSLNQAQLRDRVHELFGLVNLKRSKLSHYPAELSGGEKRRAGIARVLAVDPKLVVADEPTSALDVSIQAQVINLMQDLQANLGLSYLFISHDLQLVELLSHDIAVMYMGQIVEIASTQNIIEHSRHPYTRILWSSSPGQRRDNGIAVSSEMQAIDVSTVDSGCRYALQCPVYHRKGRPGQCQSNAPELRQIEPGHLVACHFPL